MKIPKGWKKHSEKKDRTVYDTTKGKRNSIIIEKRLFKGIEKEYMSWLVKLFSGTFERYENDGNLKVLKTKKQALKFAYSWMKKHPKG